MSGLRIVLPLLVSLRACEINGLRKAITRLENTTVKKAWVCKKSVNHPCFIEPRDRLPLHTQAETKLLFLRKNPHTQAETMLVLIMRLNYIYTLFLQKNPHIQLHLHTVSAKNPHILLLLQKFRWDLTTPTYCFCNRNHTYFFKSLENFLHVFYTLSSHIRY